MNRKNKLALITGGNKGLGLSIVKHLLKDKNKYTIVAAARSSTPEIQELINKNENVFFEKLDLSDQKSVHMWCKNFVKKYDTPYALINNAAVAHDGILGTMHEKHIEEMISINITSTILITKYISRYMLKNKFGRIINISSIIASTGFNGLSVYAATKAALIGFTKSLSRELGKLNITVNAVAPGYMETNMTTGIDESKLNQIRRRSALKRLSKTSEVASSVAYLLDEQASAITGTVITVDAGNTA